MRKATAVRPLYRQHGRPENFPLDRALELLGLPAQDEAVAFRYSSAEAAQAFAASNREHHGWDSAHAVTSEGVIGVVFLPMDKTRPLLHPEQDP